MNSDKNINKSINSGLRLDILPIARAGHPYRTLIGADFLSQDSSAVCWFEGLEKTGLHFFPDKKQITGIPRNSGSFDVQFCIKEYNENAGMEEFSSHSLKLIIEDDYDFQLGEVDKNDPYWKPDEDVYSIAVNDENRKRLKKDVTAASLRGYHHFENGKIREDDFCIHYDPATRWYILAVADGAGKSKYARQGSKIACNSSVQHCLEQLTAQSRDLRKISITFSSRKMNRARTELASRLHKIIAASAKRAYDDITAEAKKADCQPEDYASTLLLCVCKKFEFGWLIGSFTVGDGAVCVFNKEKWYANLIGGGEESSKKYFLTSPGILHDAELEKRIRFTVIDDFTALFLMTNGVSDQKFEFEDDLPCFELWNRLWNDINSQVTFSGKIKEVGEQLLKWLDFWTPGKYDDRTLAMVF